MKKIFNAPMILKGAKEGEFTAVIATMGVVDHDGDITRPGAFKNGQETLIESWNHNYSALPVGKGVIHEQGNKAIITGTFFLDTVSGMEHYKVVKNLGPLQEWSYSFSIEKSSRGNVDGEPVQYLEKLDVLGISPVQKGAGISTGTISIKNDRNLPGFSTASARQELDAIQSGGHWLPFGMSPANVRSQISELQPPGVLKKALDDTITLLDDKEFSDLQHRMNKAGGQPSILSLWRDQLKREGHSDRWIDSVLQAEVSALARRLENNYWADSKKPGWGLTEAIRILSQPPERGAVLSFPQVGGNAISPIIFV
jgi:hypothetical protein